jgi:chaperonin GroES
MATKIKPLHDKVLVERLESLEKTAGGIVLPDNAKEKPTEGKVLAVGAGKRNDKGERIEPSVKVGDKVLFGSFAGTTIREAGKELLILDEHDLLGVVDEKPWSVRESGGAKAAGKSKK